MISLAARLLAVAAVLPALGCIQTATSGSVPADAVVSIGLVSGGGLVPQTSAPVELRFSGLRAGPGQVLARRFAAPLTLDGDAEEWSGWPATEVALRPAGQAVGLSASGWYCRWRTHHAQLLDPVTGSPSCPTPCAPDSPPTTASEGSAGCSVPLPPYDHGVSSVRVRAGFDDDQLYLLLQWSAPTRRDLHLPWRWDAAGARWRIDQALREEAAYLSFGIGDTAPKHAALGCATACHVAAAPTLVVAPQPAPSPWPPASYLAHFTCRAGATGERLDTWTWRAATTAPYGLADDGRIEAEGSFGDRCFAIDGQTCARACISRDPQGQLIYPCSRGTALSNRVDGSPFAKAAGAGGGDDTLNPPYLFKQVIDPEPGWDPRYLSWPAPPPLGTSPTPLGAPTGAGTVTLPGFLLQRPSPHRDDVRARATWADGTWTLELARRRLTGDPDDAQFPLRDARRPGGGGGGTGTYSGLAASIFVPRCASGACHGGGPPPPSGVPVSLDAAVGWSQMVSVPSVQAPLMLVEPGQPEKSYLVNKLRATAASVGGLGERMPPTYAGEPLTEDEILAIEAWISSGAPND